MQLKPPGLKAMAEDRMEEKIKSTNILLFIFCKGEKIWIFFNEATVLVMCNTNYTSVKSKLDIVPVDSLAYLQELVNLWH